MSNSETRDYHDEFENLNLYIEADINQIKNEFDEYLDEWKNLYEKVEKFEKQISNNANKNKYLNTFTKSEEYTKFKDKTNIEGYNILKDELINITSKVRNSFYTTKKEFSKDEIKRLLEEFVEVGKKYNNDETYRQISFRVQGQGNKSYEELKALMNTYDDDLQYVEALLTEVENKLDGYKKKLQTT
ncbi:hypothetical protein [Mycoplasmopsis caviae]|uniref:Uncharacterized protein n=1 Tax=Mycoplasmopsis caviae TaxID=55603 RepID=A0A3P8KM56_9BACT|nr:hypothetical protein [Mycoplasmopsis caviae]VDR41868.1 Uncharacterised protein [Mycoplasmopsis caviae]